MYKFKRIKWLAIDNEDNKEKENLYRLKLLRDFYFIIFIR